MYKLYINNNDYYLWVHLNNSWKCIRTSDLGWLNNVSRSLMTEQEYIDSGFNRKYAEFSNLTDVISTYPEFFIK